jgi:hypothetical protein
VILVRNGRRSSWDFPEVPTYCWRNCPAAQIAEWAAGGRTRLVPVVERVFYGGGSDRSDKEYEAKESSRHFGFHGGVGDAGVGTGFDGTL